jgi:VIT1/CCC1 family predicted Fe2+/Mn2+ transporter
MSLIWLTRLVKPRTPTSVEEVKFMKTMEDEFSETSLLLPSQRNSSNLPDIESQSTFSRSSTKSTSKISARVVSDAVIGLSDGLTVPFALSAGLSALGSTKVVIYGGLAELIAGAISMGLGGYLGAKSELASYNTSLSDTQEFVNDEPAAVRESIENVFSPYRLPQKLLEDMIDHLATDQVAVVDFIMRFDRCEIEPAASRALASGGTIAGGYFLGGMLPLLPYFFVETVGTGLWISIVVMAVALFVFGWVKTGVVEGWGKKTRGLRGAVEMVVVGGAAAGAAMGLVRLFNGEGIH